MRYNLKATLAVLALVCAVSDGRKLYSGVLQQHVPVTQRYEGTISLDTLLALRGGAKKKKGKTATLSKNSKTVTGKKKVGSKLKAEKDSSLVNTVMTKYKAMLPLCRLYMTMIGICTILGLVLGEERAQAVLTLDPMRTLYGGELWRPLTAASYFGKPSIGALMSVYYLYEYGSSLERAYGEAQYLIFLFTQLGLLTFFSMLFRQPVFGNSMVTAMLHVLSRAMPNQKVKWLVMTIPYWALPYATALADCLQAGSAAAALPHVLGILSGHFYQFHKFVWPKVGGEDWLTAPDFLIERMDPNAASKSAAKESLSKALKSRKRGKGKKLGR
mmetsp:Transcript_76554/g.222356  ORF Transcript_76554/g.222356 Transcript_76554/m.222356 type:complete len:329 (-) Transcript_76554:13-999(-)